MHSLYTMQLRSALGYLWHREFDRLPPKTAPRMAPAMRLRGKARPVRRFEHTRTRTRTHDARRTSHGHAGRCSALLYAIHCAMRVQRGLPVFFRVPCS
jgi:hypothetical protein